MKKFFFPIITVIFFYLVLILFIDINYEIDFEDTEQQERADLKYELKAKSGLFSENSILKMNLLEIDDPNIPDESKPKKTIEILESRLSKNKFGIFFVFFLLFFCFSTFVSILFETWYSIILSRFFSFFSILFFIRYPLIFLPTAFMNLMLLFGTNLGLPENSISAAKASLPILSFLAILNIPFLILSILGFRKSLKLKQNMDLNYQSLYIAGMNDEENNTKIQVQSIHLNNPKKQNGFLKSIASQLQILKHFVIIIFSGILIGNLIYVPLFSLQKHYQVQFGYLLLGMLILVCLFYIRNYYKIGKESNISTTGNVLVSLSFLQFRFLRNTVVILFSILAIIIFVSSLYILLFYNSTSLQEFNIIDKTINL